MICYRDMTFCASDCTDKTCPRFISDDVKNGAMDWTLSFNADAEGALICVADFSATCPDYAPGGSK